MQNLKYASFRYILKDNIKNIKLDNGKSKIH